MGGFSFWHWIIVALVVLVLFGRGKISETMGDFGKGIKSFRKGLSDTDDEPAAPAPPPPAARIAPPAEAAPPAAGQPAPDSEPANGGDTPS